MRVWSHCCEQDSCLDHGLQTDHFLLWPPALWWILRLILCLALSGQTRETLGFFILAESLIYRQSEALWLSQVYVSPNCCTVQ
jgi:hypothetical protein